MIETAIVAAAGVVAGWLLRSWRQYNKCKKAGQPITVAVALAGGPTPPND